METNGQQQNTVARLWGIGQTLTCVSTQENKAGNLVADFVYTKDLNPATVQQQLAILPYERANKQLAHGNKEEK